ncbi:PucR family transcriptional regulator [Actinophytocola xinjiangensis]|uniref:PucR family transcriptional regulator n=1 Tax=Actinophytocola xinjiangensis TaxID=485602 RepID=A0A7Z0WMT9_9PSEU|nr:helix-turn-helix domain-containing protein [Actinophytocola xinjiangensis]OLF08725.1 PucR family transcriptional regulator [Actinophytocola xinjiangensis]
MQVSEATLNALERASGKLASAALASMDQQFPWFGRMPADQRASVQLIAQTGAAGFTAYLRDQGAAIRLTTDAFRQAPQELSRWISLRQTVELVRVALHVIEREVPDLAADDTERLVLTDAVLRYGREVAFTAAMSYASAAETRGAWDARLEASVVDGIVRGDAEESLLSRAAALGWDLDAPATVLVGNSPSDDPPTVIYEVRSRAARANRSVLLGVQGSRLVVVLAGVTEEPSDVLTRMSASFGDGPVVAGPTVDNIADAHRSSADALSGLRAVVAWPTAPRPVRSTDLLPERALAGDPEAEWQLIDQIAKPLEDAGGPLLQTVETFLEAGGVLETCARLLFVHPNTVRYRLRKATELTGRNASVPRDALVLRIALAVGRLSRSRGLW